MIFAHVLLRDRPSTGIFPPRLLHAAIYFSLEHCQDLNIMNLALNCWFSQFYNTRILTAKLSPYYFTCLYSTYGLEENNNKIYCRRQGCLSASETRDAIGFRQQLNTTSFEAFELKITVNYPVLTWTDNGSFMRNLTSWSMAFWLVFMTEHDVLHCYAPNVVYHCLVAVTCLAADI